MFTNRIAVVVCGFALVIAGQRLAAAQAAFGAKAFDEKIGAELRLVGVQVERMTEGLEAATDRPAEAAKRLKSPASRLADVVGKARARLSRVSGPGPESAGVMRTLNAYLAALEKFATKEATKLAALGPMEGAKQEQGLEAFEQINDTLYVAVRKSRIAFCKRHKLPDPYSKPCCADEEGGKKQKK